MVIVSPYFIQSFLIYIIVFHSPQVNTEDNSKHSSKVPPAGWNTSL